MNRRRGLVLVEHFLIWLACTLALSLLLPVTVAALLNFMLGIVNGMVAFWRWEEA